MEKEEAEQMVVETVREAGQMHLDALSFRKQSDKRKETSGCLLTELEHEKQRVKDHTIQLCKEYASSESSREECLSLRKSKQSLLGESEEKIAELAELELKENEDDLIQCSVLGKVDNNVLSTLIDKMYIYDDATCR
ncbi:MAG: hypothetical protein NC489_26345 [Ruminococcus flavefaciens]|nr:hypothetical protein [Ruminococcus flavefaciens]